MISLTINKSYSSKITLQRLLKDNLAGAFSPENLDLRIYLNTGVRLELIDNLLDLDVAKSKIEFVLDKDSFLDYQLRSNSAVDKQLKFRFEGQGAKANIKCFCLGSSQDKFKFKTIQNHQVENSSSDLIVKGIFDGESKLICDSLIYIAKGAQKVQASQVNKNILISDQARAISIPKLEIKADNVKCHHGAAVSKLDEEKLFYLQSRGMDINLAKNLLIQAFLN